MNGFNFNVRIFLSEGLGARKEINALKQKGFRVIPCPGNLYIVLTHDDRCIGTFKNLDYSDSMSGQWVFETGMQLIHREAFDIVRTTFNEQIKKEQSHE